MIERAFFFNNHSLLLPVDFPDAEVNAGVPLELANSFKDAEILKIPSAGDPVAGAERSIISAVYVSPEAALPQNWRAITVRQLLTLFATGVIEGNNPGKILRSFHLAQWHQESRFCGSCGSKNGEISLEDTHRLCPKCGRMEFPRICPAVIVIITDEKNRILLAHNKNFKAGVYSHIAGFNEAGETLEETVAREVKEEVNIEVKDIVYIKSQPWPFPNSLMLGFRARYSSGTIHPNGVEIDDVDWFNRDNLPELSAEGSMSRFLTNQWLDGTL